MRYLKSFSLPVSFLISLSCAGQIEKEFKPYQSVEVNLNNPIYFFQDNIYNFKNELSYGVGGQFSINEKVVKISLGAYYTSKNYSTTYPIDTNTSIKTIFHVDYLHIPFLVSFKVNPENEKNNFYITTGALLNFSGNFRSKTIYSDGNSTNKKLHFDARPGISNQFGIMYSRKLSEKLSIYIKENVEIKLRQDFNEIHSSHFSTIQEVNNNLTNERISIGTNVGISYAFR
ncbi:MAG: outer membrane beta-barrel protein [Bacteroidetes bacterium]|nr:outer membrane beta-barrel protein [Bacteroidota bacterium]